MLKLSCLMPIDTNQLAVVNALCRSNNGKPPTAWLNTLPAPTLTSIMLKRSRILAGWVRSPGVPRGQVSANAVAYTDAELEELKSKQPET